MARQFVREKIRVEVTPRSPGDYGFGSIGGMSRTTDEETQLCEIIAGEIRRHVDGLGRGSVQVQWDRVPYCEFCNAEWTEGDSPHNGGCCEKDCEILEAVEAAHTGDA